MVGFLLLISQSGDRDRTGSGGNRTGHEPEAVRAPLIGQSSTSHRGGSVIAMPRAQHAFDLVPPVSTAASVQAVQFLNLCSD